MFKNSIKITWAVYVVILLALFFLGQLTLEKYRQNEVGIFLDESKKELDFVASIIQERLQTRDYQLAKEFIMSWGDRAPDVIEIVLTASNGFELAHYNSKQIPAYDFSEAIDIQYSYDSVAKLKLRKKLDNLYSRHNNLLYELLAGYFLIGIFFGYLTYTIIQTKKQKKQLLLENERRTHTEKQLVEAQHVAQLGNWVLDHANNKLEWSAEVYRIFEVNPDTFNVSHESFADTIHPDDRASVIKAYANSIRNGKPYNIDHRSLMKDGRIKHINERCETTFDDNGKPLRSFGTVMDITERKLAEEQIKTLSQAVEQSPVSVMITDAKANIEYVNSTFEHISGYSKEEVIGKNPRILKSGKTPSQTYEVMWEKLTSGKAWQGELLNRRKNGETFWENAHIAPVLDESGKIRHYLAVREDITLRKQQEDKILHQAHFDALTNLPNRFLSLDRLSQLIREAQRNDELVAVVFLDLDDFKKINDTLGHDIGDKFLIKVAERLENEVRSGDTVGRLGGDEFIILLGGLTQPSDAHPVVENLLNHLRDPFRIDGREMILTASVGISIFPTDGDNPSELLRNADSAMYHSKEEGRNTYSYFTDAMNQGVSRRLALEEQMHGALERHEFRLNYQPKIDISSGAIIGVEALLRWNNPALGEVSPDDFIPIAEQTGLIMPIGQFVLNKALETTSDWLRIYELPFTIAVNLSPRQFRDPNLAMQIQTALAQSGVSGESLELEITEGVLMSGHAHIEKVLTSLHDLGICLALDDFGTGYSSLSYLRRFPFDVLKIDRSFVHDIAEDEEDKELVNASIAMAHSLGLKVVAEGIETEEQLRLLAAQNCEIAQGYFFSEPVPAEEITRMLESANDGESLWLRASQ